MKPFIKRIPLGNLLVKRGKLTSEAVDQVLKEYHGKGMRLGEALIEKGLITEEDLAQALAEQFHLSYYPLDNFWMNPEFFKTIPVELMYRYPFVPYGEKEGSVVILVSDPTKMAAMDELEWIVNKKIIFGISSRTALLEAL